MTANWNNPTTANLLLKEHHKIQHNPELLVQLYNGTDPGPETHRYDKQNC